MYCSIEDAWGDDFNKHSNGSESESTITNSASSVNSREEYKSFLKLKEKFGNDNNSSTNVQLCTQTMTHINTCKVCQEKLKEMYQSDLNINNICKNIMTTIKENNDVVTLVLICFLIILLIKLFLS